MLFRSGSVVDTTDSYGRIKKDNVYLRSSYSTSSASKASLSNGTYVRITRKVTSGDSTWYYVSVKIGNYTQTGYVRSDMIDLVSSAEYGGSDKDYDYNDGEIVGTIRITGSNVRMRTGPGTVYDVAAYAQTGETYYYVAVVDGWYQVRSGYWISSEFARILSGAEEDEYLNFNSNASYSYGSTGVMVSFIQEALTSLGYYKREISGHYGTYTEEAVKKFQAAHNLKQTGVADKETIQAIRDAYYGSGSNASTTIQDVVYNVPWFNSSGKLSSVYSQIGLNKAGTSGTLTDLRTGRSFNIKTQSAGNHADLEPATAADTATLCQIYGVVSASSISYKRRPMLLTMGGYQFVCSIYAQPHGKSTISGNNYDGQFCLHFNGSTIHNGDGGSVAASENHPAIIQEGIKLLQNQNKTIKTTFP